jgi:hypothetical protein
LPYTFATSACYLQRRRHFLREILPVLPNPKNLIVYHNKLLISQAIVESAFIEKFNYFPDSLERNFLPQMLYRPNL